MVDVAGDVPSSWSLSSAYVVCFDFYFATSSEVLGSVSLSGTCTTRTVFFEIPVTDAGDEVADLTAT